MSVPTVTITTPANEWAKDTTAALDQHPPSVDGGVGSGYNITGAGNQQPVLTTTNSYSSAHFPGAYPKELNVTDDIANAFNSAKQYIPAPEDVQKALVSAGETAAQYLPTNMAHKLQSYLPGTNANTTGTTSAGIETSLPTTEFSGARPGEQTDGAGALPGLNSESGVAKLPDERAKSGQIPTLVGGATSVVYAAREAVMNSAVGSSTSGDPSETLHEIALNAKKGTTALPSTEQAGSLSGENHNGVGILPGLFPVGATSVVTSTPDVPQKDLHPDVSPPAPTHIRDDDIAATNEKLGLLGLTSEQPLCAPSPPPKDDSDSGIAFESISKPKPAQLGLKTSAHPPGHTYPVSPTSAPSVGSSSHVHSPADQTRSPAKSGGGKSKFMDKVRGEVKIISGKLGGNSEKVEEGKRLITGSF